MAQIQWFPGHMAKAKREIADKIKLIDIVVELVDARAPYSSKNPLFNSVVNNKPRLIVMTKEDLADDKLTQKWIDFYKSKGYYAISVNLKQFNEYKKIIQVCKEILKDKMAREAKKGLKPRAMRAMVLGIPNVGKSTFINRLAKRKATVTGNKPGVTKAQQIIKILNYLIHRVFYGLNSKVRILLEILLLLALLNSKYYQGKIYLFMQLNI